VGIGGYTVEVQADGQRPVWFDFGRLRHRDDHQLEPTARRDERACRYASALATRSQDGFGAYPGRQRRAE